MNRHAVLFVALLGCGARSSLREVTGDTGPDTGGDGALPEGGVCVPEPERCNGRDDDCDGRVDEGLRLRAYGEAIELRGAVGDTGDCSTCNWAWDPVIAPLADGGMMVLWWISIYGGRERPNLWGRRLSAEGVPREAPRLLSSDVVMNQQSLAVGTLARGETLVGASFRVGAEDRGGWLRVSSDGTLSATRMSPPVRCGTPSLFTGSRVVCAFPNGAETLQLSSALVGGGGQSTQSVAFPGLGFLTTGGFGERLAAIGLSFHENTRRAYFVGISPDGRALGAPRETPLEYVSYPRLVGTREGWLYVTPGGRMTPARFTRLDPSGNILSGPLAWSDGHRLDEGGSTHALVHHPLEASLVAAWQDPYATGSRAFNAQVLDERGTVEASVRVAAPGTGVFATPSVYFARDRFWVSWHDVERERTANRVYLQSFGCGL